MTASRAPDLHVGVGVADDFVVEDEGVALHVALAAVGVVLDPDEAAVGGAAAVLGDRLRHDLRGGLGGGVDHLGAGVLVLAGAGVGDREHLAGGLRARPATTAGYFIVTWLPMLPSIHSMWPSASTRARLVTRLKTLFDQFWMVV